MELKQLKYFLAVADSLNFRRAAEMLYVSQPTLSYQIAELERELGTELFARDRRRVYLTGAGQALMEPARLMLAKAEELSNLVRQEGVENSGVLRIGFDDTEDHFELIGVTQAVADFATENPHVRMEMNRCQFPECADRVIYDELDLAFLIMRHKEHLPPDLVSRTVYRSRLVAVGREDSPATTCAEAIRYHELLLVGEKPRGNSRILRMLEDMKLEANIRRVDSMTSGFVYAQMGRGIMLLSETYYNHHNYTGLRAIAMDSPAACITHEAVWNRGTTNRQVERLLEMLPDLGCGEEWSK